MIQHLEHNEIDFNLWDACIEKSGVGLPYAFSWYLNVVCESWSGLVYGNYDAVMPLPYKRKLGIRYVYHPFFTQQLGVYGNSGTLIFLDSIPTKFKKIHTLINHTCKEVHPQLLSQTNLVLDLKSENIFKNFSNNCKRNIKKAERFNLKIKDCNFKDLIQIFRENKGKGIKHLKEKNYSTLESLILKFSERDMLHSLGVYSNLDQLLGGVILLQYKKRIIFFFSALNEEGKNLMAMFYLIDFIIQNKMNDFDLLDFEGSNNEDLARFYKGFGANEQNYFSYKRKLKL
ncbi:MAG: GNAT family N-acetyltransferase [Bacteroidota bacterium]|jgi:lipid II:glycine glycyltransferase (peptidoglycan interpeptide bridge formation enzyme)